MANLNFLFRVLLFAAIVPLFSAYTAQSTHPIPIEGVKNLFINTVLVKNNIPQVAIVAPTKQYPLSVQLIHDQIQEVTGISVPVYEDIQIVPDEILKEYNIIAVGNMSSNSFIEKLYRQWYSLLDLKYPGKGGYVVRSLHNPYGTGRNVIFVGGSDDDGVKNAAKVFADVIEPGDPLQVGWLQKIQLGAGIIPPKIIEGSIEEVVYSWRDSWRKDESGQTRGYKSATYFGWNPISIAGILYYMTGQVEFLEYFKTMAIPDPDNIPLINRTSDAFTDPLDPLIKSYHYRAHLVDCVYDLIEESPIFNDEERLFITNKLLQHQYEYDPDNTYSRPNGSRHDLWHMLGIYTGSRYFSKSYPDEIWDQRIDNVRSAFSSFINNPTWGERDTLYWVSTSTEPVFEFFILDGNGDFVNSGTAKRMMDALEIMITGKKFDEYNKYTPISLLHKAAFLLKNTRYNWMGNQLGFDFEKFRIGQSYWPPENISIETPDDLLGNITVFPLAESDWKKTKGNILLDEGFQILSYRSGLTDKDDLFLVDGFFGLGRNPYHLNTLRNLRMFNGRGILNGPLNDIDVWSNGISDTEVALSAALKGAITSHDIAFVKIEVPDMPASAWQRYLFYIKDKAFIVTDRIIPQITDTFNIVCSWEPEQEIVETLNSGSTVRFPNGVYLSSAVLPIQKADGKILREEFYGALEVGKPFTFANLFSIDNPLLSIKKINTESFLISGHEPGYVCAGNYSSDTLSITADFAYIDKEQILLAGAHELIIEKEVVFQSDQPVTCYFNFEDGLFKVITSQICEISLTANGFQSPRVLAEGTHVFSQVTPYPNLVVATSNLLDSLQQSSEVPYLEEQTAGGQSPTQIMNDSPLWELNLGGKVTNISYSKLPQVQGIWCVSSLDDSTSRISKISPDGVLQKKIQFDSELLTIWPARTNEQVGAFALLAGFKNDSLRAFSSDLDELWRVTAEIDPSFKIGDRYYGPWFTDPNPPYNNSGINSMLVDDLWGNGTEEIAIGRACTVEFRSLNGDLISRVPTNWGDNTSLAMHPRNRVERKDSVLLIGKQYTGSPELSGINEAYENMSDKLFSRIPSGYTYMNAWMQRGLSHLAVKDLDNDGVDEVIFNLSGHWNELRVYNGESKMPLWFQNFGPDMQGKAFMKGLEIMDMNGDGQSEVIVGMRNGWVCAFDHQGMPVWQYYFDSPVICMDSAESDGKAVVGLGDGKIALLDAKGHVVYIGKLQSSIQSILSVDGSVYAGTKKGVLAQFKISERLPAPFLHEARPPGQ